jgi:hypothetical protein
MKSGVTTSSAAPVSEMLRTVQSIAAPPNDIVPAFSIRCLAAIRCSFIGSRCAGNPRNPYGADLSASLRETNTCSKDCGSRSGRPVRFHVGIAIASVQKWLHAPGLLGRHRQSEGDLAGAVETLKQMVADPAAKLACHSRARSQFDAAIAGIARRADNGRLSHNQESYHDRPRISTVKAFAYRNRTATPVDSIENPVACYGSRMAWTKRPPKVAAKESFEAIVRGCRQSFGGVATSITTLPGAVQ